MFTRLYLSRGGGHHELFIKIKKLQQKLSKTNKFQVPCIIDFFLVIDAIFRVQKEKYSASIFYYSVIKKICSLICFIEQKHIHRWILYYLIQRFSNKQIQSSENKILSRDGISPDQSIFMTRFGAINSRPNLTALVLISMHLSGTSWTLCHHVNKIFVGSNVFYKW